MVGALVALVLAAVLAAPAPAAVAQPAEKDLLAAAQAVLDAREAAVAAGDRDTWMATVDPQAPADFKEAQERHFDGLREVPIEGYQLEATLAETGDLSAGALGRYGDAAVFVPETRMRWRFRGYDERLAVDSLWLTFVERRGRWYVGGDSDLADLGIQTWRFPWDFGPVETIATEHALVVHHPEQADRAKAISEMAERAFVRMEQVWDRPWSRKVPIYLPADQEELGRLLQSTLDLDKFVAFVLYGAVQDGGPQALGFETTAPRMYLQDRNLARHPEAKQTEFLVHELAHAAGAVLAGPYIPAWVHEGVADWVATGRSTKERKPAGSDGVLPEDFELSTGSGTSIVRAYNESRTAMSYLSARSGGKAPLDLFATLGSRTAAPGDNDHLVDAALREATGLAFVDFQQGWARR